MARTQQPAPPARERLLAAAEELFYARGINATGIDAIVERAGVSLATCYKHFGGKDRLVAAYLEERDQQWRARWEDAVAAANGTPQRALALFDALEQWWSEQARSRGCAQVNAAVEIANPEHPAFAVVTEHKRRLGRRLAELVAEAGIPEAEQVAADIVVIYEGTITALLLDLGSDPFDRARRLAGEALRAAGL